MLEFNIDLPSIDRKKREVSHPDFFVGTNSERISFYSAEDFGYTPGETRAAITFAEESMAEGLGVEQGHPLLIVATETPQELKGWYTINRDSTHKISTRIDIEPIAEFFDAPTTEVEIYQSAKYNEDLDDSSFKNTYTVMDDEGNPVVESTNEVYMDLEFESLGDPIQSIINNTKVDIFVLRDPKFDTPRTASIIPYNEENAQRQAEKS